MDAMKKKERKLWDWKIREDALECQYFRNETHIKRKAKLVLSRAKTATLRRVICPQ